MRIQGVDLMSSPMRIPVYGKILTTMEIAFMVHLSTKTVIRQLKQLGYPFKDDAGDRFMLMHGIVGAEQCERRLARVKNEHPDYFKAKERKPVIRFAPAPSPEPKKKKMSYTEELRALGFEPWPSDYEMEARVER